MASFLRHRLTVISALCATLSHYGCYAGIYPVPADHMNRDWVKGAQEDLRLSLEKTPIQKPAKNVIFFLGDGMGMTTVWAARVYTGQRKHGTSGEEYEFTFDKFPWTGLSKTYNVNFQIPDSAGTATAFLCGVKANAGTVGVNQNVPRGNCSQEAGNHVTSILNWSKAEGKATGIVTTTRLTHATPAASFAHSANRDWEVEVTPEDAQCKDIAYQLTEEYQDINVIFGGGRIAFTPVSLNGKRKDGLDLLEIWRDNQRKAGRKFAFVENVTGLNGLDAKEVDYAFGVFAENHLAFEIDRKPEEEPSLAEMTKKAIEILQKNENGYFLLVEGGRIDHAHHEGTPQKALRDTWSFDEAILQAVSMTNEEDTLIVVTADHSHAFATGGYPTRGNDIVGHLDPKAAEVWEPALDGMPYLTLGYLNGIGAPNGTVRRDITNDDILDPNYVVPAMVPTDDETHGGEDVPVYARGPMAHLLSGVHEQHFIAHVMAYASCVGPNQKLCENAAGGHQGSGAPPVARLTTVYIVVTLLARKILS